MPVLADDIHLDASTQERLEGRVSCRRLDAGQLPVGEVAQPGAEAEAEHDAENEDMVRYAPCVDVVGVDLQAGAMVQQAVEHIGCLVGRRGDHPDMIGSVLVREMGVEAEAGIDAIASVDLTRDIAALAGAEELAV